MDISQAAFEEWGVGLVLGGINRVRGKVVREDHRSLPHYGFDFDIVPGGVCGVVVGPGVTAEFEDDF